MTEYAGSCLEVVVPEDKRIRIAYRNGPATYLVLSPHGLYDAAGQYTSPVLDAGSIVPISSIDWEVTNYGGSSVSIQMRFHTYVAPTGDWSSGEMPDDSDTFWGIYGLSWVNVEQGGGSLIGEEFRYAQWRAAFTPGGI